MSLLIELNQNQVKISSYQLAFDFQPPPEQLTAAALATYKLLRTTPSILRQSSESERREVIGLLQAYGLALFQALIPNALKSKIHDHNGIVIFTEDAELRELPFVPLMAVARNRWPRPISFLTA